MCICLNKEGLLRSRRGEQRRQEPERRRIVQERIAQQSGRVDEAVAWLAENHPELMRHVERNDIVIRSNFIFQRAAAANGVFWQGPQGPILRLNPWANDIHVNLNSLESMSVPEIVEMVAHETMHINDGLYRTVIGHYTGRHVEIYDKSSLISSHYRSMQVGSTLHPQLLNEIEGY